MHPQRPREASGNRVADLWCHTAGHGAIDSTEFALHYCGGTLPMRSEITPVGDIGTSKSKTGDRNLALNLTMHWLERQ